MSAITHTRLHTGTGEDFGPRAFGMVTFHTFEQSDPLKNTIKDAIAGAAWQDRQDVAGSYNRIVAVDGVLSTVVDNHASGGINPGSSAWAPKAWLYQNFSAEEIRNPNYFTLNVCAMTRRAWSDVNGWDPRIIDGMARSWIDEEMRIGRKIVPTNHLDFQTNRSDAGLIATNLIKQRYAALTGQPAQGTRMADITNYKLETIRIDGEANVRAEPSDVGALLFKTVTPSSAVSVGWKGDFIAYWLGSQKRWAYTSISANVLSREPFTGGTVEVIKEVPTGITQAQVDAAVAAAKTAERTRIANAEAARIKNT
jgi:hypothetical protein